MLRKIHLLSKAYPVESGANWICLAIAQAEKDKTWRFIV